MSHKELLATLFAEQKKYIDHFFSHMDMDAAAILLKKLKDCQGLIFFSGVGKSGLVARKIADTMTSTGTKSLYLSPTNALHGDIGIVGNQDIFVFLSKSGESEELHSLVPALRNKGAFLVAIVCQPSNQLTKLCDLSIHLPLEKELCPFGMAPTTSAEIQMIFGDVMAIALMQEKKFRFEDYRLNHPAGRIGRRMLLKVSDLMISGADLPKCLPEDLLINKIVELSDKKCGCLLVLDKDQHLKGIFTDGDLRRALEKLKGEALQKPILELMTLNPKTAKPEILAIDAVQKMEQDPNRPITVLPILDDQDRCVGIVRMHDILQSGLL